MILLLAGILAAALVSLYFATLTYALRDFSRPRLEQRLVARGRMAYVQPTIQRAQELVFVTAVGRLVANVLVTLGALALFEGRPWNPWLEYISAVAVAVVLCLVFSVILPSSLAQYLGEAIVSLNVRLLHGMRVAMAPLTRLMGSVDRLIQRLAGADHESEPEEIEQEILSVVEEGVQEGVVDKQERQMIESVIEFRDTDVGQTMTGRPEIVAIEIGATLDEVRRTIEESGHSRIPIYDGTLDHVVGILYARDLLKHLGQPPEQFDIRSAMRPAIFVPESKPLRDLLLEFRMQKVHMAVVLDEYGGTAGVVTIEDILEELVGEISDEHEPQEQAMLRRINETTFEADARMYIDELNRQAGLSLPEDAGYDTVGGYVSTTLGRIPQKGTTFEQNGARFIVLDAEPQRVNRLKIELLPQAVRGEGRG